MNHSDAVTGAGLDLGSTTAKFVMIQSGVVKKKAVAPSYKWKSFTSELIPDGFDRVFSTGYFRRSVPHKLAITEITAAKAGVKYLFPEEDIDVILDIGGQDTKVIEVKTNRFVLNDKCSAGTGAFLEFSAKYFNIPLEDMNKLHQEAVDPVEINNTCGVFAISEMISHLVKGASQADVIAGMHIAWAKRIRQLLPEEMNSLAVIGGVALNLGVCNSLKKELPAEVKMLIPQEPDLVNALGAVVYGCLEKGL